MINISFKKKDNHINYVKIKGHANYADEGFDIVCASVSSIAITTINAIIRIDEESIMYRDEDGLLEIGIIKDNNIVDILIENMISMLKELEEQYSEYIKIK